VFVPRNFGHHGVIAGSVNNGVLCAGKAAWLFALRAMKEKAVNDFGTNDSIMNKYATRRVRTDQD
jgi:hypothetical protein